MIRLTTGSEEGCSVAPGGALLYETFAAGNERFGKPSNPDFLLRPGELLEAHPDVGLDIFKQVAQMDRTIGIGQGAGYQNPAV